MQDKGLLELKKIHRQLELLNAKYELVHGPEIKSVVDSKLNTEAKKIFELCDGNKTVSEISKELYPDEKLSKSNPKVSYHLGKLVSAGLIFSEKDGSKTYYFKTVEV